ncbi:MAG: DUF58 domain-containing protein [Gemmataceae bacterium]|nr:DUF58 domain-containing protein [Gemmataceae bacterium]
MTGAPSPRAAPLPPITSNPPLFSYSLWSDGFRIPRPGRYWLMAVVGLMAIGWMKSINLLLLLSYLMLMAWGINFALAGRRLRRLEARRRIDGIVFAQTPFPVLIDIFNPHRAMFGFWIEDVGKEHDADWFLVRLGAGESVRFAQELTLPRRGRYDWQPLTAISGYPFGLAQRSVRLTLPEDLIVLPRLGRLHRGRLRRFLTCTVPQTERQRNLPLALPTAHAEFHGLRPYRSGDSPRGIHWRTSARRGELMVREYENALTDNLVVVLDLWVGAEMPNLGEEAAPWVRDPHFLLDQVVHVAATICWEWCRQKGDRLVLAVAGPNPLVLEGVTSRELAVRMLECLAVQQGETRPGIGPLLKRLHAMTLPPGPILALSTRSMELGDLLMAQLRRPVSCLTAAQLADVDFYERPSGHDA